MAHLFFIVNLLASLNINSIFGESAALYIYYFDHEDMAFVIESVEGNNREILANFSTLDVETEYVLGPGWSPSGNWFAYTSRRGETDVATQAMVVEKGVSPLPC